MQQRHVSRHVGRAARRSEGTRQSKQNDSPRRKELAAAEALQLAVGHLGELHLRNLLPFLRFSIGHRILAPSAPATRTRCATTRGGPYCRIHTTPIGLLG